MPTLPKLARFGWHLLHEAVLQAGAEVDSDPSDIAVQGPYQYLDVALYSDFLQPVLTLAGVDPGELRGRATLIEKATWKGIRQAAREHAPDLWKLLSSLRLRTGIYLAFLDIRPAERFPGCPTHSASDLISILRCAHWLVTDRVKDDPRPVEAILWGLMLLGASWRNRSKAGYCKYCFRRSRPGSRLCSFHWQGSKESIKRNRAVIEYRNARRADALRHQAKVDGMVGFIKRPIQQGMAKAVTLSQILYPMRPVEGWGKLRDELVIVIEHSPHVASLLEDVSLHLCSHEDLATRLRERLDPFEFDDSQWIDVVLRAEEWLGLEASLQRGVRGKGVRTATRVEAAMKLADEGKTIKEIAAELGVTPAAVYGWKARYPEFAFALAVAAP